MKIILLSILMICLSVPMSAEQLSTPTWNETDFLAKKKAYLAKEANLSKDEAEKFFPLYFELQKRKKANNSKAWEKAKETSKNPQATETDFEASIYHFIETEEMNAKLEREYMEKGCQIISPSKIFKILKAEIKFNRNMLKILHGEEKKQK